MTKLLLLGFDRARWERQKGELRESWEKDRLRPMRTVTSEKEIDIRNAAYWLNPPDSRVKYMKEAEAARKRWPWDEELLLKQIENCTQ